MGVDLVGTGWNHPVRIDPDGGLAMTGGTAKLEQSMRLILTTYPGERPARPGFGSRLRDYVFRPADAETTSELANEVRRALSEWEQRAAVSQVRADPDADTPGLLRIDVEYTVVATGDRRTLAVPFHTRPDADGG